MELTIDNASIHFVIIYIEQLYVFKTFVFSRPNLVLLCFENRFLLMPLF